MSCVAKEAQEAMSAVASKVLRPRRWIADTGSGNDLVAKYEVDPRMYDMATPLDTPLILHAAGANSEVTETIPIQIASIFEIANCLQLETTPAVLTVGLRSVEHGWDFHWRGSQLGPNPMVQGFQSRLRTTSRMSSTK